MSDYTRGYRDGRNNDYAPPVKERYFTDYSKDELERRQNYEQGRRHGRKKRK